MKIQTLLIVLMLTLSGCLGLNDATKEIDPDDKFPNDDAAYYDTDNDGMPDELNGASTSNPPLIADSDDDNDGFSDSMELSCGTNPLLDTSFPDDLDGDFECDDQDFDIDGDGIFNSADAFPLDASATTDTDGDGMPDTVTGDSTLTEDTDDDNDGWSDEEETECGSNSLVASLTPIDENGDGVCDSVSTDDDGDTYSDEEEIQCGSDPLDALSIPSDLDGDSICDGLDDDEDGDGVSNAQDMYPRDPSKHEDVPGCIDEAAFNYNSDSNLNDDSCFGPEDVNSMMSEFRESGTWHFAMNTDEDIDGDSSIDMIMNYLIVQDAENDAVLIMQVISDPSGEEIFNVTYLFRDDIIELRQYVSIDEGEDGDSIMMDDAVLIYHQFMVNPFSDQDKKWFHCEQDDVSGEWFCSNSEYFMLGEENSFFDCDDGSQIYLSLVNNGVSDCADEEDEPTYEEVEYSEFECSSGDYIYLSEVNDGSPNCPAGDDEPTYDPITQEETSTFECWDGSVIDLSQVNDGTYDCPYEADEPYYEYEDTSEFECDDESNIIPLSYVNDGGEDCEDGSDENLGEGHGHGWYDVSAMGQSLEMELIEWNGGSLTDSMSADGMDLVLSMCDSFEERDNGYLQVSECGVDVQRWSLAEIFAGEVVGIEFYDEDGSGTLTDGDSFEITEDLDETLEWNAVRLAKNSAYSDENPEVVLPGFTAVLGIVSMLGAALLVRKNE